MLYSWLQEMNMHDLSSRLQQFEVNAWLINNDLFYEALIMIMQNIARNEYKILLL